MNQLLIPLGKSLSAFSKLANLGHGSTWPGHLALKANRNFIRDVLHNSKLKVIFVVGTNGKTTTTTLLNHIFTHAGKKVIQNTSGANLLNGIASTLLLHSTILSAKIEADIVLFEIDENAFPLACQELTPDAVVALNLFRDQLDRYGEVNTIALKWQEALTHLPATTKLFLNADDPQIAFLGQKGKQEVHYFGIDEPAQKTSAIDHASDSTYCPNCGTKLTYTKNYYSHIGVWKCHSCEFDHPKEILTEAPRYPLHGLYNKYNVNAATLIAEEFGIDKQAIDAALTSFKPAFGRQEELEFHGKKAEVILAKNPAGFNQALQTILEQKAKHVLLVLNDRIADGTDVSWIWDIDFEGLPLETLQFTVSGTRAYDMALRVKYTSPSPTQNHNLKVKIIEDLEEATRESLRVLPQGETLFILPTYTAMLDVRKIITGKKIL